MSRRREGRFVGRGLAGALLFAGTTLIALDVSAIGLGPARVSSGLGEPLRMSVPVTSQPDEDVGCIQVRPHGDDLPAVFNTRAQVVRSGGQTSIEIRSPQAIDEPAIGLVLAVGCASPVARDYVLFLDPPSVSAAIDESPAASAAPRTVAPVPRRATTRPASDGRASAASQPRRRPAASSPSAPPTAPSIPQSTVPPAVTSPRSDASANTASVVPAPKAPANTRDRLSISPTEPPVVGRTSHTPQPGVFPPAVADTAPAAAALPAGGVAAANGSSPPEAATAGAATPATTSDAEANARESSLREQQAALQAQIKTLSDQIAALRVQTTSLSARNQSLEETAFSPTLVWLLMALAVLAIIVAGWMAWRYAQLRRSLEGSAWWAANTAEEPGADATVAGKAAESVMPDGPARTGGRPVARAATQTDLRSSATGSKGPIASNIERARPTVRAGGYPAAMDTDFTLSDIEAAMATVKTVSPPRAAKPSPSLEDSDFAPLGGPTLPSPFAEPPAFAPAERAEPPREAPPTFVDLDMSRTAPPPAAAPRDSAPPPAEPPVAMKPIEFNFDVPADFDPLGTDSMKTTMIYPPDPADTMDPIDFGVPAEPAGLDFELPSTTQVMSMTSMLDEAQARPARHGAAALDDLFAPLDGHGIDTILDLDERHGAPLTATEVDLLTTPDETDRTEKSSAARTRSRMARFAALVDRVDEAATTDPLRAIAQLRQFVLRDEEIPTLLWLRLFELYRRVDKKPVYDALAEHFARRYHRPMVAWEQTLADRVPQTPLSAMPSIDRAIEAQWGSDAGMDLLQTLLCDRVQDDAIVFNAVLQRDLLDAAKIFPKAGLPHTEPDVGSSGESHA